MKNEPNYQPTPTFGHDRFIKGLTENGITIPQMIANYSTGYLNFELDFSAEPPMNKLQFNYWYLTKWDIMNKHQEDLKDIFDKQQIHTKHIIGI